MPSPSAYSGLPLRAACSAKEPRGMVRYLLGIPPRQPPSSREDRARNPAVRFTTLGGRLPSLVGVPPVEWG